MERLTERELNVMACASYTKCNTDECVGYCGGCNAEEEAKLKLKEYEDLEEQGLLLKLPCKVGDKAYYIHKTYLANADKWINEIDEVEVESFIVNVNLFVNVNFYIGGDRFRKTLTPYKTLFFTKEEAETKMKEYNGVKTE